MKRPNRSEHLGKSDQKARGGHAPELSNPPGSHRLYRPCEPFVPRLFAAAARGCRSRAGRSGQLRGGLEPDRPARRAGRFHAVARTGTATVRLPLRRVRPEGVLSLVPRERPAVQSKRERLCAAPKAGCGSPRHREARVHGGRWTQRKLRRHSSQRRGGSDAFCTIPSTVLRGCPTPFSAVMARNRAAGSPTETRPGMDAKAQKPSDRPWTCPQRRAAGSIAAFWEVRARCPGNRARRQGCCRRRVATGTRTWTVRLVASNRAPGRANSAPLLARQPQAPWRLRGR